MLLIERFQRIPYRKDGRDWSGCDCWGLHRLYVREVNGIDLPAFDWVHDDDQASIETAIREQRQTERWVEVLSGAERACDLVMLEALAGGEESPLHIGTVVGPGRVMHMTQRVGVMCVSFDHSTVRGKIGEIWRYEPGCWSG